MPRIVIALLFASAAFTLNAAIEDTGKVDLISLNKEKTVVTLSLIQQLPWDQRSLGLLKSKMNSYVEFIDSGQLTRSVPEARGKSVIVHVSYFEEPNAAAETFLKTMRQTLSVKMITVTWSKLPEPKP